MTDSEKSERRLEGVRVLVLDDEESIRELFNAVLTDKGCDVKTVANGREGLQCLLQQDFDVAIVDVIMSEMDGLAFLEEAGKICPWLGVVLASGYLDEPTSERAQKLGVSHIFAKPVRLEALEEAVLHASQSKKTRVGAPGSDTVERMQYQLNLLRRISESAIDSESLIDALRSLTSGILRAMPCDVVGMLGVEKDNAAIVLRLEDQLPQRSIDDIVKRLIGQYNALSGRRVTRDKAQIEIKGTVLDDGTEMHLPSLHIVPVISGAEVRGLLLLGSQKSDIFTEMDISFLYHAANHLSTVLASLGRMRQMAIRDPLTALYNRRYFEEEIRRFWLLFRRNRRPMSVLIIDMDHFKTINDTHGHPVGDIVLQEFADILRRTSRGSDVVGRSGGDEFVVLMPEAETEDAARLAERLVRETRKHIFCADVNPMRLTLSVGFATTHADEPNISPEEILVRADQALYAAKNGGRNLICSWEGIRKKQSETGTHWPLVATMPDSSHPEERRSFDTVLVVDDDPQICALLDRLLTNNGYHVEARTSPDEALELVTTKTLQPDIALIDLTLPGENGFDFLEKLKASDDAIVRIVITGDATTDNAVESIRHGAYDFVAKPIVPEQLIAVLQRAMQYRRLLVENLSYQDYLEDMVRSKSAELTAAFEQTKKSYEFMLEAFVNMLDAREYETCQHSIRVRDHTLILASHMGIRGTQLEDFGRGALLHDIGKVGIPDTILLKIDQLSDAEWEIMKQHSEIGYNILQGSPFLRPAAQLVLTHHERYDGTGYPQGLSGENLLIGTRILGLIDAFDAMRFPRIYTKALSEEQALEEVKAQSGKHFAPEVVEAFFECYPQILEAEKERAATAADNA